MCHVPLLGGVVTVSSASKGLPADRGGPTSVVAAWPLRFPCILSHACRATLRHSTCPLLSPVCHRLPQPSERAVSPAHLPPLCRSAALYRGSSQRRAAAPRPHGTEHGEWDTESGARRVGHGEWDTESEAQSGTRRAGHGAWSTECGQSGSPPMTSQVRRTACTACPGCCASQHSPSTVSRQAWD